MRESSQYVNNVHIVTYLYIHICIHTHKFEGRKYYRTGVGVGWGGEYLQGRVWGRSLQSRVRRTGA